MNCKRVGVLVPFLACLGFGLSCWTPFAPSTDIGGNIINSLDSTIIDLKHGFKAVNSLSLPVLGARSIIVAGADTSPNRLQSGDHPLELTAGSFNGDSAIAYAEFHATNSILATLRAACSTSKVDSVYLLLTYAAYNNDTGFSKDSNTIRVFSCGRKHYPHIRNDLSPADSMGPFSVTISRLTTDSIFAVPLGMDIVTLLRSAVADTSAYAPRVAAIDTVFGNVKGDTSKPLGRPDTLYTAGPDSFQAVRDTVPGVAKIDTVISVIKRDTVLGRDTAIVSCRGVPSGGSAPTLVRADTLPFTDSIDGLTSVLSGDTAFVGYTAVRSRTIITFLAFDSSEKFIAAVHLYGSGGGLMRFSGVPQFRIAYRNQCSDTLRQSVVSGSPVYYYDTRVIETPAIPADSLVTSWQADRLIELKVDLQPLWDSMASSATGRSFRILQDASFLFSASDPVFERIGTADTTRSVVFGMLDHSITGTRTQSSGTRDSLAAIMNAGRLIPIPVISQSPAQFSLPLQIFLQSIYENGKSPTGYLYLWVRPTDHFARVIFRNQKTMTGSALFSNPQ